MLLYIGGARMSDFKAILDEQQHKRQRASRPSPSPTSSPNGREPSFSPPGGPFGGIHIPTTALSLYIKEIMRNCYVYVQWVNDDSEKVFLVKTT